VREAMVGAASGKASVWVFNWRSEASSQIYKYQNKNLQKSQKVEYIF
jgi:hypothetical protein